MAISDLKQKQKPIYKNHTFGVSLVLDLNKPKEKAIVDMIRQTMDETGLGAKRVAIELLDELIVRLAAEKNDSK